MRNRQKLIRLIEPYVSYNKNFEQIFPLMTSLRYYTTIGQIFQK